MVISTNGQSRVTQTQTPVVAKVMAVVNHDCPSNLDILNAAACAARVQHAVDQHDNIDNSSFEGGNAFSSIGVSSAIVAAPTIGLGSTRVVTKPLPPHMALQGNEVATALGLNSSSSEKPQAASAA